MDLYRLAEKIWPGLNALPARRQFQGVVDVSGTLFFLPIALISIYWLARVTDPSVFSHHGWLLVVLLVMIIISGRLGFFMVREVGAGQFSDMSGSLDEVFIWTGIFILGPTALWVEVFWELSKWLYQLAGKAPPAAWNRLRNTIINLAAVSSYLLGWSLYRALGGIIPLPGLSLTTIGMAFQALLVQFTASRLLWLLFFFMDSNLVKHQGLKIEMDPHAWWKFQALVLTLPGLALPFSILTAGLYVEHGPLICSFFVAGLMLVGFLTNQLSHSSERNRQHLRQLEQLDRLSKDLLESPCDLPNLPDLLRHYVPAMFPYCGVEIRILPDRVIMDEPADRSGLNEPVWHWWRGSKDAYIFNHPEELPWKPVTDDENGWLLVPIISTENSQPIGAIYLTQYQGALGSPSFLSSHYLAAQSLAASLGVALQRDAECAKNLAYQVTLRELEMAWKIQKSLLPDELPRLPGWELEARLIPARQASGDYYDVIPLSSGKIGLVIADVSDKGVGAAVYMALSRTYLRTFAIAIDSNPALALAAANHRILADTHSDQFVTVFYAVLDPVNGILNYVNAGHNPPILLERNSGRVIDKLARTGIPLGIQEYTWEEKQIEIGPGQLLLLYTDGITESQDDRCELFGSENLVQVVQNNIEKPAIELMSGVLDHVQTFAKGAQQSDDITLMILARN
ncbi:MAG TPA: PP2C family protein-serine/threonine phosphatase [Anaerolineaceae bacterium]|nr:PP2C family protein-serine/threonine phosphatase [Anaerolineaceae bacterium]